MWNISKAFSSANAFLYKITGGRWGSRLGKQSVLLLQTTGRRSGKLYTTPLSYYRDGEDILIVASNWGKEDQPDWFRNLAPAARTTIRLKGKTLPVAVRQAGETEYPRLWEIVTRQNPQYLSYQQMVKRQIPIMILTPELPSRN